MREWILIGLFAATGAVALGWIQRKAHTDDLPGRFARWSDLAVATFVVTSTAILSLVIEDVIAGPGVASTWSTLPRAMLTLVSLALLAWSVALRSKISRVGTVYYAQMLGVGMSDWHAKTAESLGRGFNAVRMFDEPLGRLTDPTDVAKAVTKLADDVSLSMQHDETDTGYHLAPNLLWPAAVAFGSQITYRDSIRLMELEERAKVERGCSPVRLSWSWRDRTSGDDPVRCEGPTALDGAQPSLVVLDLGEKGETTVPRWRVNVYRVGAEGPDGHLAPGVRIVTPRTSRHGDGTVTATPWAAVRVASEALGRAIHEAPPGGLVFLMARMPKTVAVSLGRRLVAQEGPLCTERACHKSACRNPWSVLVPLNLVQGGQPGRYVPLRVHPEQPLTVLDSLALLERTPAQPAGTAHDEARLVNLTPHDVRILEGGHARTVPASGTVARIDQESTPTRTVTFAAPTGGIPVAEVSYARSITGLPEPRAGVAYVVSRVLAERCRRSDLYFPDGEVRDEKGQVVGCLRLGRFPPEGGDDA